MARVGVVANGVSFWPAAAAWIASSGTGPVKVIVPPARAAGWLAKLLESRGVAATVIPLSAEALARVCGLEMPRVVPSWKLRAEIIAILKVLQPEYRAGRVVNMAAELADVLERLAVYEVDAETLRRALPEGLAAHWELNAETLLKVMGRVENFLGRMECVLPGTAAARVFAEVSRREKGWIIAGFVDAVPSARRMLRAILENGAVVVPEGREATAALVQEFLRHAGADETSVEKVDGRRVETSVREVVCKGPWQEVEAVALAVKRAVALGHRRVAVVTPDARFAERLNGALARWQLRARAVGGESVASCEAGRVWAAVLGVVGAVPTDYIAWATLESVVGVKVNRRDIWMKLPRNALAEVWVEAVGKVVDSLFPAWREAEGAEEVLSAFAPSAEVHGMVDGATASPLLLRMLREGIRPGSGSEGIYFMAPQDVRGGVFDTVIAAQMVEGIWPSSVFSPWLAAAQVRKLGMPDNARRALLMGSEFEALVHGGSQEVMITHCAAKDSGKVVSRYLRGVVRAPDEDIAALVGQVTAPPSDMLGTFVPEGEQYPRVWSASFIETLMACPYRAYAERILKLIPPDPIEPVPDARVGGLLVHAWLEQVGREFPRVTLENALQVKDRLLAVAEDILRDEDAVVRAIWKPKMRTLSAALVERWMHMDRPVEAVEKEVRKPVGAVTVRAIIDRVEKDDDGLVILDYKTGSVPAWREVADGKKPQLALEAWLLGEAAGLEYWKLRGYGREPLEVHDHDAERLVALVEEGVTRLVSAFGEGAPFPALPDRKGGGLLATGHCEFCELAGVCRRMAEADAS